MSANEARLVLLDPTLAVARAETLSPRLSTLSGKTIGVIWNGRPPGDTLFDYMYEALEQNYNVRRGPFIAKPYLGNVAPPEAFETLAESCDAVVTGVGD
jgi:hypothetical protein